MKGEILPICPVCDEEMLSEANAQSYCRLCGMGTGIGRLFCHGCEARMEE